MQQQVWSTMWLVLLLVWLLVLQALPLASSAMLLVQQQVWLLVWLMLPLALLQVLRPGLVAGSQQRLMAAAAVGVTLQWSRMSSSRVPEPTGHQGAMVPAAVLDTTAAVLMAAMATWTAGLGLSSSSSSSRGLVLGPCTVGTTLQQQQDMVAAGTRAMQGTARAQRHLGGSVAGAAAGAMATQRTQATGPAAARVAARFLVRVLLGMQGTAVGRQQPTLTVGRAHQAVLTALSLAAILTQQAGRSSSSSRTQEPGGVTVRLLRQVLTVATAAARSSSLGREGLASCTLM
jgi:hypothetical protein